MKKKVIIAMPAYKAGRTLKTTFDEIPKECFDQILLVDDASTDNTVEVAKNLGLVVIVHERNLGYGGNQKTCYTNALRMGADVVVCLHPDNQYSPKVIPDLIKPIVEKRADFTFGSRWKDGGKPLEGGMPIYRYVGNIITTRAENFLLGTKFTEMHSGLKAYSRKFLENVPFLSYSNGFFFDTQILIQAILLGFRIEEVAIPTRYTLESSSTSISDSIKYIVKSIIYTLKVRIFRENELKKIKMELAKYSQDYKSYE